MFKTLLKKQLLEFFSGFFMNAKTGKAHSKGSKAGFFCLLGFMIVSFLFMFFTFAYMLSPIVSAGFAWIYFSVLGILASLLGVFGSVFLTYNTLYEAKDNDFLLSLPIPSGMILFARMSGLYITTLAFESIVLIPCAVIYFIVAPFNIISCISVIVNLFVLPLFALSIACVLGWFIALFASRMRNKSIITVIFSIAFFAVYYVFAMRLNTIISMIIANAEEVGEGIKLYLYPLYKMGQGCAGDILSYLTFLFIVLAVFAVISRILSASFIKLATAKKGMKKKEYKEREVKKASSKLAFLKKEFLYFKSTPAYMLNCALGSVLLIVFAVFAFVRKDELFLALSFLPFPREGMSVIAGIVMCFIASTNNITSPSISLEAKNLWLLKSVPAKTDDIFFAKAMLHILVTGIPLIIANIIVAVAFAFSVPELLLCILFTMIFMSFCALTGLCINLIFPKMDWTNEAVPIKQSMSSLIGMFFGMLFTMLVIVLYFFLYPYLKPWLFLLLSSVLFAGLTALPVCWLRTKGRSRFFAL